jgi:LPS-assembly protein
VTHTPARALFVVAFCALIFPAVASAQADFGGCDVSKSRQMRLEKLTDNHYRLIGTVEQPVQIDCDEFQLFADSVEHFRDEARLSAAGHIVFVSGTNRISAERLEFNTRTRTGTFYAAAGTATMKGATPSDTAGEQEPYAFFWGDELHKLGPTKYRIVRGGFTACLQPTPRWEISSGSFEVNIDDYVLLRNALFRVKGVPLLYLPAFYYPMEEDNRSTGFLMPRYGTGTLAGQTLTNAFFWAIGRSHDATFSHDWFTKTGYAVTGTYRYNLGSASSGYFTANRLSEKELIATVGGAEVTQPARQSFKFDSQIVQRLPGRLTARGDVNYFSSLASQQRYQQNVFHATNRQRNYGANVTGSWAEYVLNATFAQRDIFDTNERLTRDGSLPRVSVSRGERPIGKSSIYFGAIGEYATFIRKTIVNDEAVSDQGLTRLDVLPTVRIPFPRWPFLSVNSVVSWRGTYWSESLDASGVQVPETAGRSFFDLQSTVRGPTFHRIWDNGTGRKIKHVIEPSLVIQRTSAIEDSERFVRLDSADYIVGGVTRYTYGLSNALYSKRENTREVMNVRVSQTYYTDARAAQFDQNYQSVGVPPSNFGAIAITARVQPTPTAQASLRTEWDHQVDAIRTVAASGSLVHSHWLQAEAGWSLRRAISELPNFSEAGATHYLNASTTLKTRRNNFGGTYSFNYDLRRDEFLQQRYMAYYNAQCCGFAAEWQTWNYQGTVTGLTVPQDRRFNISVSLAGIGAVPSFFGALSGQQNRR